MSYSLLSKCHDCKREPECSDKNIVEGSISTIHSLSYGKGHKGSGEITLDCQNFEEKETK